MSVPAAQPWPTPEPTPDAEPQASGPQARSVPTREDRPARPSSLLGAPAHAPGGGVDLLPPRTEAESSHRSHAREPRRGGSGSGGGGGPRWTRRPFLVDGVTPRPGRIRGLDGLRAIAVLAVLLYHLAPGTLPGGFVGVDVFFVVSGFLITTLLLREASSTGRIDLRDFWLRRARRLVPALVVVVVVGVFAARLAGGDLLVGIMRQAAGALTFSNNWVEIAAGSSYAASTSPQLFVNFWSLAVEEQFYLVWPFALLGLLTLLGTTRARIAVVAGIGAASALLMAVLVSPGEDPTRVYYGTDTHVFGLAAGIVLAFLWATPGRAGLRTAAWRRARPFAVAAAMAVLVGSMVWLSMSNLATFRGGLLLVSLATAVLIASLLESGSRWRTFMDSPALGWVGQRSYGLYLWHWPVIVVLTEVLPFAPGTGRAWLVLSLAVVVSFVLTALSYRYIELPVRRHGFRAVFARVRSYVLTPWRESPLPRVAAITVGLFVLASAAAALSAPSTSTTQQQIEQNEAELAGMSTGDDGDTGERADADPGAPFEGLLPGWPLAPSEEADGADTPADPAPAPAAPDDEASPEDESPAADAPSEGDDTQSSEEESHSEAEAGATEGGADLSVPTGEEMTAIGDSLVVTSKDGLEYAFPGMNLVAQSNRQWGDAQGVLDAALADGEVRRAVVVHFGTNAGVPEDALREFLDALGPDRAIVVMNLYVRSDFQDSSNETIEKVVADYPNAIVGDWHAAVTAAPEQLQSDMVHPDLDGMHLYADVVRNAFEQLSTRD